MGISKSIVKDYAKVCKENTKLMNKVKPRMKKSLKLKKNLKKKRKNAKNKIK